MDRLTRNLDNLCALIQGHTRKGARMEFIKESLERANWGCRTHLFRLKAWSWYLEVERLGRFNYVDS
jgi:hypothetical protein